MKKFKQVWVFLWTWALFEHIYWVSNWQIWSFAWILSYYLVNTNVIDGVISECSAANSGQVYFEGRRRPIIAGCFQDIHYGRRVYIWIGSNGPQPVIF